MIDWDAFWDGFFEGAIAGCIAVMCMLFVNTCNAQYTFQRPELEASADSALKGQAAVQEAIQLRKAVDYWKQASNALQGMVVMQDSVIEVLALSNARLHTRAEDAEERGMELETDVHDLDRDLKRVKKGRWKWFGGGFLLGNGTGFAGARQITFP